MAGITKKFLFHPIHFLALGFGTGCVRKMPGTIGTLAGVPFYLFMQELSWHFYLGIILVFFLVGIWICEKTAKDLGVHDHPAIVWDEVVGYLVTMLFAPAGWLWIVLGFVLFRIFDICKPWPISWLDKQVKGGLGVMLDDIVAGLLSLAILQSVAYLL